MTNVLIVEDERLAGEMLCQYITDTSDRYKLVDLIKNADNAELFCLRMQIDLILMDICTGGGSGLEAAARIKSRFPNIKIVIITSAPEYRFIEKAKSACAESFWYKEAGREELISVMDRTMAGGQIIGKYQSAAAG